MCMCSVTYTRVACQCFCVIVMTVIGFVLCFSFFKYQKLAILQCKISSIDRIGLVADNL